MERPVDDQEYIRIRRSTLAYLGVFVKYLITGANIPNRYWTEFGYDPDQMTGDRWLDAVHPEDRAMARRFYAQVRSSGSGRATASYRLRDSDGNWHWMVSTGIIEEWSADGEPAVYVGMDTEVTELHELQDQLQEMHNFTAERVLEAETLRTAGAVIASSLDKESAIERVIEQLRTMVPIQSAQIFELVGRELQPTVMSGGAANRDLTFFSAGPGQDLLLDVIRRRTPEVIQDPERTENTWLAIPLVVRSQVAGAYVLGRAGGREFSGQEIRLAMAMADYLALALNNAHLYSEMRRLASRDQLSNLLNRRALIEAATREFDRLKAEGRPITCMILDIDHFKRINDTYGHLVGDRAIREVARRFQDLLRSEDIVGRYGGEEFCAVLPEFDPEMSRTVAERIRVAMGGLVIDPIEEQLTVSIGVVASATVSGVETLDELLQHADDALYRAKHEGRNRTVVVLLDE